MVPALYNSMVGRTLPGGATARDEEPKDEELRDEEPDGAALGENIRKENCGFCELVRFHEGLLDSPPTVLG